MLFRSIKYFYCLILMYLLLFFYNFLNFSMFRDVPGCSGMFPCSGFYRRPVSSDNLSSELMKELLVVLMQLFVENTVY